MKGTESKGSKGNKGNKDDDYDEETLEIIMAHEKEFREKGLKPEVFAPFMFDLTQINFEAKEDPLRLFAYIRFIIEARNGDCYD